MPTKKLVVSTYLQYVLIAIGALLLLTFVPQLGGTTGVHPLWVLLATLAATALYGIAGTVFAVVTIPAAWRYLGETLVFERWGRAPVRGIPAGVEGLVPGEVRRAVPAGKVRANHPEAGNGR